uniref:YfhO family protein n=1 Tax=Anaerobutyricum hallii TaxID=39488 RepID=UPI003FEFFC15
MNIKEEGKKIWQIRKKINRKHIIILSFFMPLIVMIGCCIAFGVQPFGDNSLLIIDGLHQYMPFYSILYDKLKSGGSLFYSFRAGLGINFLSLYAYYLSSPLNLLILFFKKSQLNMAVSLIIVLKVAISGLTAGIYFSSKSKKPGLPVLMISMAYALSSYMVGYCWNVMWLDAIMIFPIVMMGLEDLIDRKDGRLYCFALFYALYCNYYIAFMICIFVVIWYILYSFKSVKQFFFRGIAFTFYSFLAAGMAAIMLIPAYLGIKQTASGESMSLPEHSFLTNAADLLNRQFAMWTPITHDNFDGNVNLYIGIFTVLAVVLYLLNSKIKISEKIKKVLLIGFFYLSFSEMILNFIWHGFHDQYGIPNRFSFLFGFVLLYMLWEVFENLEGTKGWHIALACMAGVGLLVYARAKGTNPLDDEVYGVAGMLFILYGMLLFLYTLSRKRKGWYKNAFCIVALIEIVATAFMGFNENGQIAVPKFFYGVNDMEKAVASLGDKTFYRSELASSLIVDENALYPINGVGLFGSTASDSMVNLMDNLGFYTGCNEYLYKGATPVTNLLLNVKYLYYHQEDTLNTDFEYVKREGAFNIYKNPAREMSMGYLMNLSVEDWDSESAYPFRVQNSLGKQAFCVSELFHNVEIADPATNGCTASKTNDGEYYFEYKSTQADNMVFTIPVTKTIDDLYLFYDGTQVENAQITIDGTNVKSGDLDGYMLPIGKVSAGSEVKVTFQLKGETETGYVRLSAADFDQKEYNNLKEETADRAFIVRDYSSNYIEGNVNAKTDQTLFFSIPYDEGWYVEVDGKPADMWAVGNAFLGIDVSAGEHTVSLSYTSPGASAGWKISSLAIVIFLGSCFVKSRYKSDIKKKE